MDRARAIAAVAEEAETIFATEGRVIQPALSGPAIPSSSTWKPTVDPQTMENAPAAAAAAATTSQETLAFDNEKPLVDVEHLQLTLQEALFLCWNLDCLTILDPQTVSISQKFNPFPFEYPPSPPLCSSTLCHSNKSGLHFNLASWFHKYQRH